MSTSSSTDVPTLTFDGSFRVPADVFSLQKFREWVHAADFPEKGRASFIAGNVEVEMSPENLETHNAVKGEISGILLQFVKQRRLGRLYVDGALLVCPAADLSTGPDAMFCSHESRRLGRVRQKEWTKGSGNPVEVVGVPDLVIEVVSKSTVRKDTRLLRKQYFLAGIPEYWLVDARAKKIDFQILVRGELEYTPVAPDTDGYRLSQVFDESFSLVRERDEFGEFEYSLLHR
jgi:Uma2 family endonuclease